MRLIMMGTGPFAVPTFRVLLQTHHEVVALVTRPTRPRRGKQPAPVTPMRDVANEHGVPVFDPEDINAEPSFELLADLDADLLVVCDYGQILSVAALAAARLGGINLHASLLPKYRGAAPINWALYHGETETGVTVIHMTPQVDAGPCIAQGRTLIDPDETAQQLEERLAEVGAWLTVRAIDSLETGHLQALPQDPALASRAPRLKKSHGQLDWSRPAVAIKNHVRAMIPWPGTYTHWLREGGKPLRLIVNWVEVADRDDQQADPGEIVQADDNGLVVAAGQGSVALESVQPAGKRALSVAEFLNGYPVKPGDRFGPTEG